jgi:hypothetical protein
MLHKNVAALLDVVRCVHSEKPFAGMAKEWTSCGKIDLGRSRNVITLDRIYVVNSLQG